ncbi:UDP-N-acetyl-D-galactosamine dehydrogenase [Breznakibacter xylanolyticus]|uniref:UDP-N-acetyl-D-galactosamine dehydrogenase n=1 Tax=Breznakibacter xylanolyticus TaxID=990 RepID=A0A2W7N4Z5_9BACT|nr:hypothetical protein [Breznakibacter xylanolyticus]PZX11924.1 UDP-N-acetyl-D-galactosamine dehydrogenase [Breznakibacter xylanolyticus]
MIVDRILIKSKSCSQAQPEEVMHEYGIRSLNQTPTNNGSQVIVLAVSHREFLELDMQQHLKAGALMYDVKGFFAEGVAHGKL